MSRQLKKVSRQFKLHCSCSVVLVLFATAAQAQNSAAIQSPLARTAELQSHLDAAAEARASGDSNSVTQASKRVIALALAQMAEVRLLQSSLPVAVALYQESLQFENASPTHLWLALVFDNAGHIDEARKEMETVLASDPHNADAWNLLGKLQLKQERYAEAAASLQKSLDSRTDLEVAYTMATALLKLKDTARAAAVFRQMEEITGKPAAMHVMAGRAYEAAGYFDQAESEYKQAIASDAKAAKGHYFLGLFYLTRNQWEPTPESKREFQHEVAFNPTDFFGNYFLGFLASGEKNYEVSDRYLKIAAAAKPDWPEPYLYMGLNANGRGDDKEAERLLRQAVTLTGSDESRNDYQIRRAYFALGRILIRNGQKEKGFQLVSKSREMENRLVLKARQQQALDSRDINADSTGSTPLSEDKVRQIPLPAVTDTAAKVEVASNAKLTVIERSKLTETENQIRVVLGAAFNDLGTSYARRREFEPAVACFQKAERWNSATENVMRNLGMAAFFSRNYAEAARALKIVASRDPEDQRVNAMLALSLSSIGEHEAAAQVFKRIGEPALDDPGLAYRWALSLQKSNHPEQAGTVLQKWTSRPLTAEMFVMAGKLYAEMGDTSNAQACYEKAKIQNPDVSVPK